MNYQESVVLRTLCFMFLQTVCLYASETNQQSEIENFAQRLTNVYGIKLHYKYNRRAFFPHEWLQEPVSAKGWQISTAEIMQITPLIDKFLSAYSESLLKRNISDIYLLQQMRFYGRDYSATNRINSLYFTGVDKLGKSKDYSALEAMHSQFAILLKTKYKYLFPEVKWNKANPTGWKYSNANAGAFGQWLNKQFEDIYSQSFLTSYSRHSIDTDFGTFAAWSFTQSSELEKLASKYNGINTKCKLLHQFYWQLELNNDAWQQKKDDIEKKYGIEIILDNIEFAPEWKVYNKAKYKEVPLHLRLNALCALKVDLEKYPPSFLANSLTRIYLVQELKFRNLFYGGTYEKTKKQLFLISRLIGDTGNDAELGAFHHELSSILMHIYKDQFPTKAWHEANPPAFKYEFKESTWRNLATNRTGTTGDSQCYSYGFLCHYGSLTFEDDVNTYAQYLLARSEELDEIGAKYPRVKQKANLLRQFYQQIGAILE